MRERFFCYAPKEKWLETDCPMKPKVSFEVSLPSEPPLSLTPMEDTRVLSKSLLFVVLYSYNCHLCLFLCTFLVICKGLADSVPLLSQVSYSRCESILAEQTQTSFFLLLTQSAFPPFLSFLLAQVAGTSSTTSQRVKVHGTTHCCRC